MPRSVDQWGTAFEQRPACLAGAVMAHTLGADPQVYLTPAVYKRDMLQLAQLDYLGRGQVGSALAAAEQKSGFMEVVADHSLDRHITSYVQDLAAYKRDMVQLVADLEEAGL